MRLIRLGVTVLALASLLCAQTPIVNSGGVVNSGSYAAVGAAPGSIVSIFGTNLAAGSAGSTQIPLPTRLSDVVSVTFNDVPAPLFFVGPLQINAQLPWNVLPSGTASGAVNVVVTRTTGGSVPQSVQVAPAVPGIFTLNERGFGQAIATDNADGAIAAPAGVKTVGGVSSHPIKIGDYLIVWCTGLGPVNPPLANGAASSDQLRNTLAKPSVLIGGVPATPVYSVISPQFVGLNQIGVQVAANTPTGDTVPLQIQVNGVTTSNQVTIAVASGGTTSGLFHTLTPTIAVFEPGTTTLPGLPTVTFDTADGPVERASVGYQGGDLVGGKVIYWPWAVSGGGSSISGAVGGSINQGVVLSYDASITGFDASSHWKFFDMTTLQTPGAAGAKGYNGAVIANGYAYPVPHGHLSGNLPTFVKYDTSKAIDDPAAYQTVGAPPRGGVLGPDYGWCTGVFDGRYVYYVPAQDLDGVGAHGNIVRYDTTTPFDLSAGGWAHFDMTPSYPAAAGFQSAAYDGHRFIYYVPFLATVIVRYDTQYGSPGIPNPAGFNNPVAYKTLDPTSLGTNGLPDVTGQGSVSNLRGFTGAQVVWDASHTNEYLYLVPWGSSPVINGVPTLMSTAARVRIGTQSGNTWSYVDITGTDSPATAPPDWEIFDLTNLTANPQWQVNGWPLPAVYPEGDPLAGQNMIAGWQLSFVNTAGPSPRVGFSANMSQYWVEHDVGHALSDPEGWYVAQVPPQLRPGTFGGAYDAVNQIFYPSSPSVPLVQANGL
jgi:uncharacterized protein (TIGR03437 family)